MNETSAGARKQAVAGDREWEGVVRRIADRIHAASVTGEVGAAQRADLAEELAGLERRAIEAEDTLVRERDANSTRVKEMEEKLRKLEPWLRRLRSEFQEAAQERDKLRERLAEAEQRAAPERSPQSDAVLRTEHEAAAREVEAAVAARDAALAEAASLRMRLDNDLRNLQESWKQRIETAESSRDKALDEIRLLRQQLSNHRRAEEEIKRLVKEKESLETTTSVHKAVARAAQEEAETLGRRVAESDKAVARAAADAKAAQSRSEELEASLTSVQADLARLRDESAAASKRVADGEAALREIRADAERLRGELAERDRALTGARAEADGFRTTIEKLRADLADARQAAERQGAETSVERTRRAEELERLRREAAEGRELAEVAMRAEGEARKALADAEARFAAEGKAREEASVGARDLESRLDAAQLELGDVRRALEAATSRTAAVESERANLVRSLDEERRGAAKRFEAAEASWRSQMRAVEGRFEVDIHKERQRAAAADAALAAAVHRYDEETHAHAGELEKVRGAAAELLRRTARVLTEGAAEFAGTSLNGPTVEIGDFTAPATAEMSPSDILVPAAAPDPTIEVTSEVVAEVGAPDWDRLLSDVHSLRSQVEGLRKPPATDDTASVGVDEPSAQADGDDESHTESGGPPAGAAPAAAAGGPGSSGTQTGTPAPSAPSAPASTDHTAQEDSEIRAGRKRRRK